MHGLRSGSSEHSFTIAPQTYELCTVVRRILTPNEALHRASRYGEGLQRSPLSVDCVAVGSGTLRASNRSTPYVHEVIRYATWSVAHIACKALNTMMHFAHTVTCKGEALVQTCRASFELRCRLGFEERRTKSSSVRRTLLLKAAPNIETQPVVHAW
jgi:hypothetical protein